MTQTTALRAFLVGAPLAFAALLTQHPMGTGDMFTDVSENVTPWLIVHYGGAIGFPLMALVIWLLIRGLPGRAATIARVALPVYAVFYTVWEAIFGIATGILADAGNDLSGAERDGAAAAVDAIVASPLVGEAGVFVSIGAPRVVGRDLGARSSRSSTPASGARRSCCFGLGGLMTFHVPIGPPALVCLSIAAYLIERRRAPRWWRHEVPASSASPSRSIAVHVIDDSFVQPQPGTSRRRSPRQRPGRARRARARGVGVSAPARRPPRRAGAAVRPVRDRRGRRGRALHDPGRRVRRRLHRAARDPRRARAARARRRDAVADAPHARQPSRGATCAGRCSAPRALVATLFVVAPFSAGYLFTHLGRADVAEANLGARYERVSFTTSDGLELAGWYVPSKNGAAVIAFPGRNGPQAQTRMLVRHGYGVLLFDRRGQGESEGDPHGFGWEGEKDIKAAIAFLQRRPDVDPERIGGLGLSVGGELMLQAAAETDALKAVVSEGAGSRSVGEFRRDARRVAPRCTPSRR